MAYPQYDELELPLLKLLYEHGGESLKSGSLVTPFGPSEYTITLHGTTGLPYHGSIMVVGGGSSRSRSVDGVVPATFTETGDLVSVSFQKEEKDGLLAVIITTNCPISKCYSAPAHA